ncbi:D-arabinose 1-dehydrogenase-like Zn-dependent alcohol dehydrogenase [Nakamurella sp. UYEF19]
MPTPVPGRGEVRIKVGAAGVCLSDVHLIDGPLRPLYLPGDVVTLGHEVAGTVDVVGPEVTAWAVGQRVLLQAGELRGGAVYTRGVDYDGGWAEYAVAREHTLVAIGDDLPFEQACFIPDAVSTPWAAITATAQVLPGRSAGVWGVGGLGAHAISLLRLVGAAPIIAVDPLPTARERALAFGADFALDPADPRLEQQLSQATGGAGLSYAFDFAGVEAVREQAIATLGKLGKLILVGLTDKPVVIKDGTRFSYLQQQVLGHYGSEPAHVEQLVGLVAAGRVDFARSVSELLPLSEAVTAVEHLRSKTGNPIRIVLVP